VTVNIIPNPEAAADARKAVVSFFVKHLKPWRDYMYVVDKKKWVWRLLV
jgi:hypothetical protein